MEATIDPAIPLAQDIARVIAVFDEELRSDLPFVNTLTAELGRRRGKLLRPKLLLTAGRATGTLREEHIILAAVVEMVHVATLVHDDVLDDAEVRRQNDTMNRLIGNEGAVLLGDYLISHSYHLCSRLESTEASRRIAAVTNTICEGELMQIENRGNFRLTEAQYLQIIERKTASLTSLCCELGAIVSGASSETCRHLAEYGLRVGMAFQIVDDLLDLTATQGETGKSVGRDAELGELTLPLIRFLGRSSPEQQTRLIDILSNGDPHKSEAVLDVIDKTDCIDQAMDVARSYLAEAIAHLAELPESGAKAALIAAAESGVHRRR